jgi:hypothetical protein
MFRLARIAIAVAFLLELVPVLAQVPAPVPALPDVERRTAYTIAASQCSCTVNMALYGDSNDFQSWVEVWLNGTMVSYNDPTFGWTITSPSGPLLNLARPITDGVLTFNTAQTGTVQIVGARRPRRVSQFAENAGVSARNLNQVITDIVAMLREVWDKINDVTGRAIIGQPGETLPPLPAAASRAGEFLCFNSSGQPTLCAATTGSSTLQQGTGISLSGSNPTVISTNLTAGTGIAISGATISTTNGVTNVQTGNYTIQPSDCNGTVLMGTGATGFQTLTLPTTITSFANGCIVRVRNNDAWPMVPATNRAGKSLVNFPADFTNGQNILWPQSGGAVELVGGVWVTSQRQGRAKVPSGMLIIYSDFNNGTDTPGATDGFANGSSAFHSLEDAMYMACNEFELNSLNQTLLQFNMAASTTDTLGVHYACPSIPGGQGGAYVQVTGGTNATINTSLNASCVANSANCTDAFDVVTGATVSIFGITFSAGGTVATTTRPADCLRADYGGRIFFAGGAFSVCSGSAIAAENGGVILVQAGNYVVEGNSLRHFFASTGGIISTDYIAVTQSATIAANVTMASAWASAGPSGTINVPSWTSISPGGFTVTGVKTLTTGDGSIFTGTSNSACIGSYFPGTVNNTVAAPFCE